jgi:hypothetical protein
MSSITKSLFVSLIVVAGLAGSVSAAPAWTGAVDNDWFNGANWDTGSAPTALDYPVIANNDPDGPVIAATGASNKMVIGSAGGDGALFLTLGASFTGNRTKIGADSGATGRLFMSGGTFYDNKQWELGEDDDVPNTRGEVYMTGGLADVAALYVPKAAGNSAHVQMDGGEIHIRGGGLYFQGTGSIDLAGGKLSAPGDVTNFGLWTAPIAAGFITAYGLPDPGDGSRVSLEYDPVQDMTFLCATVLSDFDGDCDADGRDFLIWQNNYLTPVSDGDADGNGFVDGDDLIIWQTEFGGGAALSSGLGAVPEPSTLVLLLTMGAMACVWRK